MAARRVGTLQSALQRELLAPAPPELQPPQSQSPERGGWDGAPAPLQRGSQAALQERAQLVRQQQEQPSVQLRARLQEQASVASRGAWALQRRALQLQAALQAWALRVPGLAPMPERPAWPKRPRTMHSPECLFRDS